MENPPCRHQCMKLGTRPFGRAAHKCSAVEVHFVVILIIVIIVVATVSLRANAGALNYFRKFVRSMSSLQETKEVWQRADAVCFDVDSTVLKDEGIDELAKFCGVGQKVAEWTSRAMSGSVRYRESLASRLEIMQPSLSQVQEFLKAHPPQFTPGMQELVKRLHARNTDVYLVSGGFRSIIEVAATQLNIPFTNIFANRLLFYANGEYAGFEEKQPTSDTGGKPIVIENLKAKHGYKNVVMIGDGATDMEACPPADAFIGFGGNVVREKVKQGAKWFVTDFQDLIKELEKQ